MTIAEHLQRRYPPLLLGRILAYACTVPVETDTAVVIRLIGLRQIAAEAWNDRRLAEALARLEAGESPPPIDASRWQLLDGSSLYALMDGNRRMVAARMRGHRMIRARLYGTLQCREPRSLVWGGSALCEDAGSRLAGAHLYRDDQDAPAIIGALQMLGLVRPI